MGGKSRFLTCGDIGLFRNCVGHRWIDDGCVPVFNRELTGNDRGGQLDAVVDGLQDVAALRGPQRRCSQPSKTSKRILDGLTRNSAEGSSLFSLASSTMLHITARLLPLAERW